VEGRQPALGLLGEDGLVTRLLVSLLLLCGLVAGCSGGDEPSAGPNSTQPTGDATASSPTSSSPTTPAPPTATPAPRPQDGACYRLDYRQAVAPTAAAKPVRCSGRHTALTYGVGRVDAVVDGHLLAVDSDRVQAQVAAECPRRLPRFLGGSAEDLRLSMLRAVWFTPSVAESDAGADWYRCDVIAVAADEKLAPLSGRLAGILDRPQDADRYGMCGTAGPGSAGFRRVICSSPHSWRAIATVGLAGGRRYPGEGVVREAGQDRCQDEGRAVADDALNFQWGYEAPTRKQWESGQHYGLCWAPD
jgi:hypothetical protein